MTATIISISRAGRQDFSNQTRPEICLIEGLGVEDAGHAGTTVQHLSRIAKNADQPKLSKIHVIRAELRAAADPHRLIAVSDRADRCLSRCAAGSLRRRTHYPGWHSAQAGCTETSRRRFDRSRGG
jgi:hypothetical protein